MIPVRPLSRWIAPSALVMLAGACDDPATLAGPSTEFVHESAVAMARLDGSVTVPFVAELFTDQLTLAPDESCGTPPRLLNIQEGSGEATHLGRFSVRITFCIDATDLLDDGQLTEGESLPYDSGTGTLTAADGSELHFTIAGAVVPSDHPDFAFEFKDPFDFTGGTGRFSGAGGSGVTDSLVDRQRDPTRTHHRWTGTLTLPRGR